MKYTLHIVFGLLFETNDLSSSWKLVATYAENRCPGQIQEVPFPYFDQSLLC